MPTKTSETRSAILRRYREFVAADCPAEWPYADAFAKLYRFAQDQQSDVRLRQAVLAIRKLFRVASMPYPSEKSATDILAAISQ